MSADTKKMAEQVKETFKRISRTADEAAKMVQTFDKDLATKIRRVGENAGEVSKHVEERSGR